MVYLTDFNRFTLAQWVEKAKTAIRSDSFADKVEAYLKGRRIICDLDALLPEPCLTNIWCLHAVAQMELDYIRAAEAGKEYDCDCIDRNLDDLISRAKRILEGE